MGSCCIGQAGLEFIGSSDPLTSTSWITGTPRICCHAWLNYLILIVYLSSKTNEICSESNTANDSPYWFFIKIYIIWCSNTQITLLQKLLKVTVKSVCSMMNYDSEVVSSLTFFFLISLLGNCEGCLKKPFCLFCSCFVLHITEG